MAYKQVLLWGRGQANGTKQRAQDGERHFTTENVKVKKLTTKSMFTFGVFCEKVDKSAFLVK